MPAPEALTIVGAPGSPYSRKLRAVLRYRRIPHRWVIRGSPADRDLPAPPVALVPVIVFPGEETAHIDSTPLIRELERRYPGRAVVPPDPALAFLDALLEDYADEWLTKAMFHYRWSYPADIDRAARLLPRWSRSDVPEDVIAARSRHIAERQIERLWVVGSNVTTAPVIEDSYRRLLGLLDAHLSAQPFVLGGRPGAADFGLFGQLTQLVDFDPTPSALALEHAPRVVAWVSAVEDLSGWDAAEDAWAPRDALPPTLHALVAEVGRVYAPFLVANARALASGAEQVEATVDGRKWVQRPFPYQGKCLAALREQHAALAQADRRVVDGWLAGSGCEALFRD